MGLDCKDLTPSVAGLLQGHLGVSIAHTLSRDATVILRGGCGFVQRQLTMERDPSSGPHRAGDGSSGIVRPSPANVGRFPQKNRCAEAPGGVLG